jgi:hypothetical protein
MKNYLIKTNKHLETINNIFPGMIRNVFVEITVSKNLSKETITQIFNRYVEEGIKSRSDIVYLDPNSALILELISGEFVFFGAACEGANLGKYTEEFTIVENIDEVV